MRFLKGLAIGMLIFLLLPGVFHLKLLINRDESLKGKLFLSFPSKDFRLGDYVVFPAPETPVTKGKNLTFLKKIECMPGDRIIRKGREFYCLHYLGRALERTKDGIPLSPSDFEGRLPENCYWVKGDHERSYDSRYFGPVCSPKRKAIRLR